jgi:fatty acid desaturase
MAFDETSRVACGRKQGSMKYRRYSPRDVVLVAIAVAQLIAMTIWATAFRELSPGSNLVIFVALSLVFYYNPIVVTHNFLHTPFFRSQWLNRAFPVSAVS